MSTSLSPEYGALTNVIRRNSSGVLREQLEELAERPEHCSTYTLTVLRQVARAFSLEYSLLRKSELCASIITEINRLKRAPLTHGALRDEATLSHIDHRDLTYRDLTLLLGYDQIPNAGKIFLIPDEGILYRLLSTTTVGSVERLRAIKQVPSLSLSNRQLTSVHTQHQLLFTELIPVTEENKDLPVLALITNNHVLNGELGNVLRYTTAGSLERKRLLSRYDEQIINTFRRQYRLNEQVDLLNLVIVGPVFRQLDNRTYEYTHDRNRVARILATTNPNTLGRYASLCEETYGELLCLDELICHARIPDLRPQSIRDYRPDELEDLSLSVLHSLAIREGLYDYESCIFDSTDTVIEKLMIAWVSPVFSRTDVVENTTQTTTTLLTELREVPTGQLYSYGIRDGTCSFYYYEREELLAKFLSEGSFSDPQERFSFNLTQLRRLYILALSDKTAGAERFQRCLADLIELEKQITDRERELIALFQGREDIKRALELLFQSGMYMRRWDGNLAKFPLLAEETRASIDSADQVEEELATRVHHSLEALREGINVLPSPYKERFWALDVKTFKGEMYFPSFLEGIPHTLRQRFHLVCQGNQNNVPIDSCIRLTSNCFIYTALYYHYLIFRKSLYQINPKQVQFIS